MQHPAGPVMARELAALRERRDALRQSAGLPGAEPGQLLEAVLAELDGAIDVATELAGPAGPAGDGPAGPADAERRLLRTVFAEAPVPLFLLERNGTIRRANRRAGELLGAPPGYATGKLLTAFVGLPSRAAVATHLAAAARTGLARQFRTSLLGAAGAADVLVTTGPVEVAAGPALLLAAVTPAAGGAADGAAAAGTAAAGVAAGSAGRPDRPAAGAVQAMTARMDLVTAATRLLLENATFSEPVTLRRCARLLAGELAAWVIVDVERRQRLRRQVVIGPPDAPGGDLARLAAAVRPAPGTLPHQVHETGNSQLIAHAEDLGLLGDSDGMPLLMRLEATSVLSVPVTDSEHAYGVLTLARHSGDQPFEIADLGLVEELGQQLALTIRLDRMFRRRTEIADSLQASLLPRELPSVPGLELAAAYVAATGELDVGGDFYDVYAVPGGWGLAIGDVCGKGEEAAAVTAAARHSIRVLGHWDADPAAVLTRANELILAPEFDGRFVTACAVHLQWRGDVLHAVLGSAGHPAQLVLRADGRVQALRGGGMPLGLFEAAEAAAEELELHPGDTLFLYTDGIPDARSPDLEYFEDRLTDELAALAGRAPGEIAASLQALVLEFSANELRDDMTMLIARVGTRPGDTGTEAMVIQPGRSGPGLP